MAVSNAKRPVRKEKVLASDINVDPGSLSVVLTVGPKSRLRGTDASGPVAAASAAAPPRTPVSVLL